MHIEGRPSRQRTDGARFRADRFNGPELRHGLVVATDEDPFALGRAVEEFRQPRLDFKDVDPKHDHILDHITGLSNERVW